MISSLKGYQPINGLEISSLLLEFSVLQILAGGQYDTFGILAITHFQRNNYNKVAR